MQSNEWCCVEATRPFAHRHTYTHTHSDAQTQAHVSTFTHTQKNAETQGQIHSLTIMPWLTHRYTLPLCIHTQTPIYPYSYRGHQTSLHILSSTSNIPSGKNRTNHIAQVWMDTYKYIEITHNYITCNIPTPLSCEHMHKWSALSYVIHIDIWHYPMKSK